MIKMFLDFKIKRLIKSIKKSIVTIDFKSVKYDSFSYKVESDNFRYMVNLGFDMYEIFFKNKDLMIIHLYHEEEEGWWYEQLNADIPLGTMFGLLTKILEDIEVNCPKILNKGLLL